HLWKIAEQSEAHFVGFVKEQREINRQQQAMNVRIEKFMVDSEKRFRLFYDLIVNLQKRI
ncbi:MAG: hypothetical protein QME68_04615, partial [Elusimicrobiota bacterium]|nr:hypothetical protein [Elusimicrobiota bacterium]